MSLSLNPHLLPSTTSGQTCVGVVSEPVGFSLDLHSLDSPIFLLYTFCVAGQVYLAVGHHASYTLDGFPFVSLACVLRSL